MRLNSIRIRILAVIVLVGLVTSIVLGGFLIFSAHESHKSEIEASSLNDSRLIADHVGMYIEKAMDTTGVIAADPNTALAIMSDDTDKIKPIADGLQTALSRADIVQVVDHGGNIVYSTRPVKNTDMKIFSWYNAAAEKNQPLITGAYYNAAAGKNVFTIMWPVKDGNEAAGYVLTTLTPESLKDTIPARSVRPDQSILLVDNDGKIVAHDESTLLETRTNVSAYLPVKKAMAGDEGVVEHSDTWDGQSRVSAYTPVHDIGWGVVVSKPSQAAYQPFQDRLYTILGTMSFLMLGFTAFGYYASGNLSEPITDLLMKLKSARAGDYTAQIDVARNDEFGDLARTFNDLKGALGEKDSSLNNERELFKLLVKDLPVGMLLLGPKGEYVDCNKALLGLFGLGEERLAGKTIFDSDWALWHEPMEDPKNAHPIMIAYATHQPIRNVPIEIAHSITGEKAWLTINAEPQISPDGGLKSLICTFVDVTEPRLLSESLRLARYSLDSAPDEIHWIASDGSFYFVNSATCAALGYTEKELLSMNAWDVDPAFTPDNWPARWKEFEEKRSVQFESKHMARDKTQYPVNVRIDHIEFQGKAYICAFITNTAALKRVEQRLSAIEADFSAARQIAGIGNWSYDIENEKVQCSPEVNRIFGLDSGKGLTTYKGFMSLIHPEDRERVQRSMDDALSGKKRLDVDFRFKGVDGAVRYVHCEGDVVFDEAGKAGRIRGLIHDTTELRRVEAERDELDHRIGSERARLEAVLRNMPAGIVIAEAPSGKIRMVNQRMDDIFRHKFPLSSSIEDYGEWGVFQVDGRRLEPEDMPVARSIRLGEMVTGEEINFLRGDGTWGLLSMSSAPVCDNEGRVVDAIATFFDITESKKAENALVESKASLVKAHHIAHLGNWVWYIENNEMQYSDEMCQIYGILPQAYGATFESFLKLVLPDDRESVRRSITAALNRKEAHSIDFRIVRPDGRERIVHSEGEVVSDGLGKPIRMFGTIQDITDRKQVEGALREAKMQAELYLDLISHDINNMNQIGLGYLELAMQRLSLDEDGTALLSKPLDVLKNSSTLIDNVRKTRLAITGELKMRPVDVGEMLENVKNRYDMIPQKDVFLNYTPTKGSRVMANELLQDVMTNLIDNAIKHSGRPVNIGIGLEPAHAHGRDYYIISIEDDGPGIPDDNKSRIFERMIRGDTKAKGSGLGLYLVKTLVRSFNGKVWVENRIAGDYTKGSRFMIRLPAIKDQ